MPHCHLVLIGLIGIILYLNLVQVAKVKEMLAVLVQQVALQVNYIAQVVLQVQAVV
jgi:hypothetical protein